VAIYPLLSEKGKALDFISRIAYSISTKQAGKRVHAHQGGWPKFAGVTHLVE